MTAQPSPRLLGVCPRNVITRFTDAGVTLDHLESKIRFLQLHPRTIWNRIEAAETPTDSMLHCLEKETNLIFAADAHLAGEKISRIDPHGKLPSHDVFRRQHVTKIAEAAHSTDNPFTPDEFYETFPGIYQYRRLRPTLVNDWVEYYLVPRTRPYSLAAAKYAMITGQTPDQFKRSGETRRSAEEYEFLLSISA